jgi:transposase
MDEQRAQAALDDLSRASKDYADAVCEHYRAERKRKWRRYQEGFRLPCVAFLTLAAAYAMKHDGAAFTAAMILAAVNIVAMVICIVAEKRQR